MILSKDDNGDYDPLEDAKRVLEFVRLEGGQWYGNLDFFDQDSISRAVTLAYMQLGDDIDGASPFKRAGAFCAAFVSAAPIIVPMHENKTIGRSFKGSLPCANAFMALRFAQTALHGATFSDTQESFETYPYLSIHSLIDNSFAFAQEPGTPLDLWLVWSGFLEQLVFKTNPGFEYPPN